MDWFGYALTGVIVLLFSFLIERGIRSYIRRTDPKDNESGPS
jgi:hypothetical protein